MIKSIKEADIIEGTIVLVRTDWNLPINQDGQILDTSRVEASFETIDYLLKKGAKVVVISHFGDGSDSIEPVVRVADKIFSNTEIKFVRDPWNNSSADGRQVFDNLKNSEIAVFENLRFWAEKENSDDFAKMLADFGDIYVNEAFPVSHRKHTSIVKLPKYLPHFAGFGFVEEYEKLSQAFNPERPFLFVLGGAKFETKLPLVEKFLNIADNIFIGGEIAFHALALPIAQNPKVIFPIGEIASLDANRDTLDVLQRKVNEAAFVLWNGPLGNYENGYKEGTLSLAKMLAESKARVIVGGGDTIAAIKELDLKDKFYFISTAGGAMLDFLATGTLPGLEALENQ